MTHHLWLCYPLEMYLTSAVIVLHVSPEIISSMKKHAQLENCLMTLNRSSLGTSAFSLVKKSTLTSPSTVIQCAFKTENICS